MADHCKRCGDDDVRIKIHKTVDIIAIEPDKHGQPVDGALVHTGVVDDYWCSTCFTLVVDKLEEEQ